MPKYFVEKYKDGSSRIEISDDTMHHLTNVLRVRLGDEIVFCDGEGMDYYCSVVSMAPFTIMQDSMQPCKTELPCKITLYQAMPKSDKLEWIIQKAVELGVYEVIPVYTEHAVKKAPKTPKTTKMERYQKIAEAAAGQSMRGIIPTVHPPVTWKNAIKNATKTTGFTPLNILAHEQLESKRENTIFSILSQHTDSGQSDLPQNISVWVGPEGGFSRTEVRDMATNGFKLATLGKRILRTETAAIAALSQIMMVIEQ